MTQTMLTGFSEKALSLDEYNRKEGARRWNNLVCDWDVEYQGYWRGEDNIPEGYIDFHIIVEIVEALVTSREKKTYKKVKVPGYRLSVTENVAFPDKEWESFVAYEAEFQKESLKKGFDAFQRELLNIQSWITIAEARAELIPHGRDVFECAFCGWVTDQVTDDITCCGCGKRFWSEKLWGKAAGINP